MNHTSMGNGQHQQHNSQDLMARGIGVFSLALGAMELVAAPKLAAMMGMRGQERFIQACGVREILQGAAILASRDPTKWMWVRVAGDGLDVATLAANMTRSNPKSGNVAMALAAVLGVTALDVMNARGLAEEKEANKTPIDFSSRSGFPNGNPRIERRGRPAHGQFAAAGTEALTAQH
jgi:hypothetical protein